MQPCTCPCCALRLLSTRQEDEFLVWYVQDYHCGAAREALFERRLGEARDLVARLCRPARVQADDVADLQQEAFLVLDDAIRDYDLHYFVPPEVCLFRTFLHQRLAYCVGDFLAERRRDRQRDNRVLRHAAQMLSRAAPRGPADWLAPPARVVRGAVPGRETARGAGRSPARRGSAGRGEARGVGGPPRRRDTEGGGAAPGLLACDRPAGAEEED